MARMDASAYTRNVRYVASNLNEQLADGLYQEMYVELDESDRKVPILTGNLQRSGSVLHPVIRGNIIECAIIYSADYALYVHEDEEAFHQVGEAKFLESTLRESAPFMAGRVGQHVSLSP